MRYKLNRDIKTSETTSHTLLIKELQIFSHMRTYKHYSILDQFVIIIA